MSNNFSDVFRRELLDIKSRTASAGVDLKALCAKAGISRATPDRWLANPPNSVRLMDKLQKAANECAPQTAENGQDGPKAE